MKIAIIEPSGGLYGSEFCLLDLLEELSERHDFTVHLPEKALLASRLEGLPVKVRFTLPVSERVSRPAKASAYLNLASLWMRDRPDLVYLNQAGAVRPIAAICRALNLPLLCQVQTLEDAHWVNRLPGAARSVTNFICNSRFIAHHLLVGPEKKSVFYQGYRWKALGEIPPRSYAGSGPFTVGLLGRISESKGHYLLIEAARLLVGAETEIGPRWEFVLIGDAKTPAERKRFERALDESGVRDRFVFRGYQTDLAKELSSLHAMAIPSLAEPLGRILFEAAEAGLPVVCSDAGGLGEVSRHFGFGRRFKSGDALDLVAALQAVLTHHDDELQAAASRGRAMLKRLDLKAYAGQMEELLVATAARRPLGRRFFGKEEPTERSDAAPVTHKRRPLSKLMFVSHLPCHRHGGGKFVVNGSVFEQLKRNPERFLVDYACLPLKSLGRNRLISKVRRCILRLPGLLPAYSEKDKDERGQEIGKRLEEGAFPFFSGVTPWVGWRPDRPYFIYTDVGLLTLLENQQTTANFQAEELTRIKQQERTFLAGAAAVFFESNWGRRKTLDAYGLEGGNCHTVGRAGLFPIQSEDRWDGRSLNLVSIAKHFEQKGGDLVLCAFRSLLRDWPELRWHVIGGPPSAEARRTPGVIHEGFLDPENHRDWERFTRILRNAFLLVHPTREDTNPLVVTEAASFGCPTVSVDRFALPELVDAGRSGILIPWPPEAEALTAAIRSLLENRELYKEMRSGSLSKAKENGDWETVTNRIIAVIGPILDPIRVTAGSS